MKHTESASRTQQATAQLVHYMQKQGLADGDRLPCERELTQLLGVGAAPCGRP